MNHNDGFSLFELLIAILLFSIVMVGFIQFQTTLTTTMWQAKAKNNAQTIAFEILERYPDTTTIKMPSNWNYQIIQIPYLQCQIVKVTIYTDYMHEINQQRWFCH